MIVAIEGIDAAGKGTVAHELLFYFRTTVGFNFTSIKLSKFPQSETIAGAAVCSILQGRTAITASEDTRAAIIQSLMMVDRLECLPMLLNFANTNSNLLILDRYKLSSIAYGVADGLDPKWVDLAQSCLPDADVNIVLDIPVGESFNRRPERRDHYERDFQKLMAVRDNYRNPDLSPDAKILDGCRDTKSIVLQIVDIVTEALRVPRFLEDE